MSIEAPSRYLREMIILHEWPSATIHGYDRFSVCSAEHALEYDDTPAPSTSSQWEWVAGVIVICAAVLLSPLAVCLAGAACAALLAVRAIARWAVPRKCVLMCRFGQRKTGRHRLSRRTRPTRPLVPISGRCAQRFRHAG